MDNSVHLNMYEFWFCYYNKNFSGFSLILWIYYFLLKIGYIGETVPEEEKKACQSRDSDFTLTRNRRLDGRHNSTEKLRSYYSE